MHGTRILVSLILATALCAGIAVSSKAQHGSPAWLKFENDLAKSPEGFRGFPWCARMSEAPWKTMRGGHVHTLLVREDEDYSVFGVTAKYITYTHRNSVFYGVRIDIEGRDAASRAREAVQREYPPSGPVERVNDRETRWSTPHTSVWVTVPKEANGLGQVCLWGRDRVFPDDSKTPVYLNKPMPLNHTLKKYKPRQYVIYKASGPVTIDGGITEKAWQDAQWTEAFEDAQSPYCPQPWKMTRAKILYDDENLYVAAQLQEENVWGHITQRDSIVYYDNDFEVFVDPTADAVNYFEYEMTCLNTMFDMWHENDNHRGALADGRYDAPGLRSAVQVQGTLNYHYDTDEGWTAEMKIPFRDMRASNPAMSLPVKRGDLWRMNFSRVEYLHIYSQMFPYLLPNSPCEDWVWNTTHIGDLHIPEMWAKAVFSDLQAGSVLDTELENAFPILDPPPAPKKRQKDMVHFPASTITLGPDPTDPKHSPAHTVQVPEFRMDRYEVTVAEFAAFLNVGGRDKFYDERMQIPELCGIVREAPGKYRVLPGREDYPAVCVGYDAALAYAESIGKTLPTEAMWERAARGTGGRKYPWENEPITPERANYDFHYGGTLPVGSLPKGATPEGIHDLCGNVREWTSSALKPYPGGAVYEHWFNPPFFAPPYGTERAAEVPARPVNRGGGWSKQEKCMEAAYRDTHAAHNCGFRCVVVGK
ncbi:MAG: SUMF1/EgtB/PvdO family nonheme iron enzyme [Candidatus Latescibacterota bacterium]